MMNTHFRDITLRATGASDLTEVEMIQELWSGYGTLKRYNLQGSKLKTIVIKHVSFPDGGSHPRGWNSDLSHVRKLKSYAIETAWYRHWSSLCNENCYVPKCYACESHEDEVLIVLEDLDESGYAIRKNSVTLDEVKMCLSWLAHFHATFMMKKPENLWDVGTYWHLDTRPDELQALRDKNLKNASQAIDDKLSNSEFLTFVHGDAKLANFCFSNDLDNVAAVDFQYVGGGCGMKDVAYFIGSCFDEHECEKNEEILLEWYFKNLKKSLEESQLKLEFSLLEEDWRSLYPFAWSDFHRFIKGWSPGHWKINDYSERMVQKVLKEL